MKQVTTIIIGAGQAGLAMSYHLNKLSVDHILLERGEVAQSWRSERWDSLRLLTPNWQSRLPSQHYNGPDKDGFRDMPETINLLSSYAQNISAPIKTHTEVQNVVQTEDGYVVMTNRGDWRCQKLVLASGACNIAKIPAMAEALPRGIQSISPMHYKNPSQISDGGVLVVGGSASGIQIAQELQKAGRQVYLSTGEHVRLPRIYRGRDIQWWMDETGVLDMGLNEIDDIKRARNLPSLQLIGGVKPETIDFNILQSQGIKIAGRLMGLRDKTVQFSGSLANVCSLADLKMNRLLNEIDSWVLKNDFDRECGPSERFNNTKLPKSPLLDLDLEAANIKTVLWATGYKPDYSWLNVPVTNFKGELRHVGGIVDAPGLYAMGLPFMRNRKSTLIDGVGQDAKALSGHMYRQLMGAESLAA